MTWNRWFQSQAYNQPLYKHIDLPIYETIEFDFFSLPGVSGMLLWKNRK